MWVLVSRARRKCWKIWLISALLVCLLTIAQTITNKLGEAVTIVWLWTLISVIPGLSVLFISLVVNKYPSRLLSKELYITLLTGTIIYVALLLLTLILEPYATAEHLSIISYKIQSFWWLLPFQFLLVIGFYSVFIRQRISQKLNDRVIKQTAAQQVSSENSKSRSIRENIFELIANGKLNDAQTKIYEYVTHTGIGNINEIILLKNRYREVCKERNLDLISRDAKQIEINRITLATMSIADEIT